MPALVAVVNPSDEFWTVEYLAPALWVMGFAGESTADRQGLHFRLDSHNRGRTCQLGLSRYSRHPNYFFEFVMWLITSCSRARHHLHGSRSNARS